MSFDFKSAVEPIASLAAANAVTVDAGAFPAAVHIAMRDAGLLGLVSATAMGGKGEGLAAAAYVVERLARECGSSAMVICMHYCAAAVIEAHGDEATRRAVASGKHLSTLAFSEPGSRSHFWASLNTAQADGDGVRITGKKGWVTSAHHADSYIWSTKPTAGTEMSSLWLVPRTTAGLRIDGMFDGLGLRGNDSAPVTAEGAHLPATARLGADGAGFGIMMGTVLPWFSVLNASCSAGLMEAAVQRSAKHVSATKFDYAGSSIADLPTIRAYIARMRIKTDQTKALNADAISAIATGREDTMLRVLEVKGAAGEAAAEVGDLAMRVCGARDGPDHRRAL
jgi:alkylation response protein AidB-like acyl-CoA dehydrogenase